MPSGIVVYGNHGYTQIDENSCMYSCVSKQIVSFYRVPNGEGMRIPAQADDLIAFGYSPDLTDWSYPFVRAGNGWVSVLGRTNTEAHIQFGGPNQIIGTPYAEVYVFRKVSSTDAQLFTIYNSHGLPIFSAGQKNLAKIHAVVNFDSWPYENLNISPEPRHIKIPGNTQGKKFAIILGGMHLRCSYVAGQNQLFSRFQTTVSVSGDTISYNLKSLLTSTYTEDRWAGMGGSSLTGFPVLVLDVTGIS